ncbi:GNAT family N-acetyltransferase [Virgibacillus sp. MG-45]|uniref:GNAT family N-acetyltransferase n=1 Tax=Virgibacillus sp. MG-45 TaxID=3102791 RepID=UPI002EDACF96
MQAIIRQATERDVSAIQHVARTSWKSTYEGIIPEEVQNRFLAEAYSDQNMEKRLAHSVVFVAEQKGQVVGFANFSPNHNGKRELGAIYLLPAYQGKGIGTSLLEKGLQEFQELQELYINVEKDNEIGMHFYQAKGFEVSSQFDDDFDGHILKTVRMVLKK